MTSMSKSLFLVVGMMLAGSALAQANANAGRAGVYVGVEGGAASLKPESSRSISMSESSRTNYLRAAVGYQISRNLAMESGYFVTSTLKNSNRNSSGDLVDSKASVSGFDLAAVYKFDSGIYLKGGSTFASTSNESKTFRNNVATSSQSTSKSGLGYLFGVGYQFDLSRSFAGQVGYTRLQKLAGSSANINAFSVGAKYHF